MRKINSILISATLLLALTPLTCLALDFNNPPKRTSFAITMNATNVSLSVGCTFNYCQDSAGFGYFNYNECVKYANRGAPKKATIELYTYTQCQGPFAAITFRRNGAGGYVKSANIHECPPDKNPGGSTGTMCFYDAM
jgi:hypothetical protein